MIDIEKAKTLYCLGEKTIGAIAAEMGVSQPTIRNHAIRLGWVRTGPRSSGECDICGKSFSWTGGRKPFGRIFCGPVCRGQATVRNLGKANESRGYHEKLTSGTVGAIHELVVAADCLKRGLSVFRAMDPACKVDFLILDGTTPFRLEVTSGSLYGEKLAYPTKDSTRFDLLAVVLRDWSIRYAAVVNGALIWADSVESALTQFREQVAA